jgi:hypothetical protein
VIHYHGTTIGGQTQDAARFLVGRHALVPFSDPGDLGAVMECCQSFVLDNGAFSEWKRGRPVDFDGYVQWVSKLWTHPGFDWCLIPDVIDGSEQDNQDLLMKWVRIGLKAKGVPVWHLHESLDWLAYLVDRFEWVALGSSGQWSHPGTRPWWARMDQAMSVCCFEDGRPKCKLHGLRMLNPEIFSRLPLASADSTNAAVNSGSLYRFGQYKAPTRGQRAEVIAARIEAQNSAHVYEFGAKQHDLFAT